MGSLRSTPPRAMYKNHISPPFDNLTLYFTSYRDYARASAHKDMADFAG
jgi:hypothetical protein